MYLHFTRFLQIKTFFSSQTQVILFWPTWTCIFKFEPTQWIVSFSPTFGLKLAGLANAPEENWKITIFGQILCQSFYSRILKFWVNWKSTFEFSFSSNSNWTDPTDQFNCDTKINQICERTPMFAMMKKYTKQSRDTEHAWCRPKERRRILRFVMQICRYSQVSLSKRWLRWPRWLTFSFQLAPPLEWPVSPDILQYCFQKKRLGSIFTTVHLQSWHWYRCETSLYLERIWVILFAFNAVEGFRNFENFVTGGDGCQSSNKLFILRSTQDQEYNWVPSFFHLSVDKI